MLKTEHQKPIFILSIITSILTVIVSAVGIFRIEIYAPLTPEELLPGTMSQDIISFLSALGLLLVIVFIRRGANRAWLIWLGLTGYLLYAYAIYAFDRVYNMFFLCYIAVFGLSLYAIILFFISADLSVFTQTTKKSLPRKTVAVYLLSLVLMFLLIWLSMIIPGIQTHTPPDGNSIFVLDLSFFLPLLSICAVQLVQKKSFGHFLAAILLIKMGILGFSVFLGEVLRPLFHQELDPPMIGVFAFLGLGGLLFAAIFINKLGTLSDEFA